MYESFGETFDLAKLSLGSVYTSTRVLLEKALAGTFTRVLVFASSVAIKVC